MNNESPSVIFSALTNDYLYAYEKVGEYFNGNFRELEAFQRQAERINSRKLDRKSLASVLLKQNQDFGCGNETLENIKILSQNRTCAVVTGQQVGLFSGPLYTIYKALTVIKLAEYLSQNLSGCFVPVFWLASEDHDFAEIDHINLLDKNHRIEKIRYGSPATHKKIPAFKWILTLAITDCFQHLQRLTPNTEFKQEVLSHLSDSYRDGHSFAEAFAGWITRLFKSFGLVLVDASHPELKKMGKRVFGREITEGSPSTKHALATSEKLIQAGYHTQIQLHEGILNLFLAEDERRIISLKSDVFSVKDEKQAYKKSELLSILENKPEIFSPNVLLRPVYQDALFPTVTYVGGPGEIAYFAQMKGVYESFGLTMPVIYPRKTVTLLEKNVGNILENYDISIRDIWEDADKIIGETVKKRIPGSIDEALRAASLRFGKEFRSIKKELAAFGPGLEKSADLASRKVERQLKFLEEKVLRAAKKQNGMITQQIHKAKNNLYPENSLQERVFNIVPYLIKYDFVLLDKLCKEIDIENFDHQVIKL